MPNPSFVVERTGAIGTLGAFHHATCLSDDGAGTIEHPRTPSTAALSG